MIAHISSSILKEVMREGLNGEPREGRHRLPNGTQSTEQDVRAISVGFQAELAAKLSQPKHGLGWPALGQEKDELSGHQDESKDTAHALHAAAARPCFVTPACGVCSTSGSCRSPKPCLPACCRSCAAPSAPSPPPNAARLANSPQPAAESPLRQANSHATRFAHKKRSYW